MDRLLLCSRLYHPHLPCQPHRSRIRSRFGSRIHSATRRIFDRRQREGQHEEEQRNHRYRRQERRRNDGGRREPRIELCSGDGVKKTTTPVVLCSLDGSCFLTTPVYFLIHCISPLTPRKAPFLYPYIIPLIYKRPRTTFSSSFPHKRLFLPSLHLSLIIRIHFIPVIISIFSYLLYSLGRVTTTLWRKREDHITPCYVVFELGVLLARFFFFET